MKQNHKKIIQNSPEKFHNSRTSGHTNFVLHQSKVKPVNAITKSEFQEVTVFANPKNQRSQHLEQLAILF